MEFGHAQWRKSNFGAEDCVEIAYDWRKSSFSSETADCVEVAYLAATPAVGIRDSKNPTGGHLTLPTTALRHLTAAVVFHHR